MSMQHVPIRRAVIEKNLISNIEPNHNQTNYTANNRDVTSTFIFFILSQLGTYVYDWYALKTANEHRTLILFFISAIKCTEQQSILILFWVIYISNIFFTPFLNFTKTSPYPLNVFSKSYFSNNYWQQWFTI